MPYSASKAGMLGLTRSSAAEAASFLKDGEVIRSNAIVPGYIETPMIAGEYLCFDSMMVNVYMYIFLKASRAIRLTIEYLYIDFSENEASELKSKIPVHRFGDPHEVADAAVFLARNEYANNCVLNLDGGLSAV